MRLDKENNETLSWPSVSIDYFYFYFNNMWNTINLYFFSLKPFCITNSFNSSVDIICLIFRKYSTLIIDFYYSYNSINVRISFKIDIFQLLSVFLTCAYLVPIVICLFSDLKLAHLTSTFFLNHLVKSHQIIDFSVRSVFSIIKVNHWAYVDLGKKLDW